MKNIYIIFLLLLWITGCSDNTNSQIDDNTPKEETYKKSPIEGYVWVWGDEFDEDEVDESKWVYRDVGVTWIGSTMCRPENVSVNDGYMKITLIKADYTDPVSGKTYETTAGGLVTKERFGFGYYEVSAKLSPVKGWHEAFWGHWSGSNNTNDHFEGWQTAAKTEIDCFEHTADYDNTTYTYGMYQVEGVYPNFQNNSIHRDMHFGTTDLTSRFNTYGFEYTADYINYFLNGDLLKTVDIRSVDHQKIHLWLTTISTKTPEGNGEVLWDYLRCFQADENSDAYKERKEYFLQVLKEMEGETSSEGIDLWVEAEDFISKGGWTEKRDENNMVLGGHSSTPDSEEAKTAKTTIKVKVPGEYVFWVRSKDYKDNLPGTRHFQVHINGAIFPGFGKHGSENLYDWQKGGVVYLHEGENNIELYDSSCYYASCDKILFTTDKEFIPTGVGGKSNVEHVNKEPEQELISLWVESEDFTTKGGWTIVKDGDDIVLRGHADRIPPADDDDRFARTTINIKVEGNYILWVRSKDFKNNWPGTRHFDVWVNGEIFTGFGKHGSDNLYDWQKGGVVLLKAGENKLEIYDSSCYYANCDKLLLTTDKNFTPTGKGEETNVEHK